MSVHLDIGGFMVSARTALALVALVLLPSMVKADDYSIDLGTHPGGEVSLTISPGVIRPLIRHRLPGRKYSVTVVRESIPIMPLPLPGDIRLPTGVGAADPKNSTACSDLQKNYKDLGTPADESGVGAIVPMIQKLLDTSPCIGPTRNDVQAAKDRYDNTLDTQSFDVASGQQLRVTVIRLSDADAAEKTWVTTLSTGPRGEWLTTYGMSFALLRDQRFFTKATDTPGQYVITREREDSVSSVKYLPSVLFSWMPAKWQNRALAVSPTAGFGISNSSFAVLAGATVTYNTNLGVTAGVAIAQQQRLIGSYTENQVVKETLTEDALNHNVLTPAAFVSITFRFGSNPFKSASDDNAQTAAKSDPVPVTKGDPTGKDKPAAGAITPTATSAPTPASTQGQR